MHPDRNSYEKFHNQQMNTEEIIEFLEQIDSHRSWLEELMKYEEQQPCITTPKYLKEQILSQAVSTNRQHSSTACTASNKIQFFYWGLRTVVGVAAALVFLFGISTQIDITSFQQHPEIQREILSYEPAAQERDDYLYDFSREISDGISDSSQKVTDYLNELSNKLLYGGK